MHENVQITLVRVKCTRVCKIYKTIRNMANACPKEEKQYEMH